MRQKKGALGIFRDCCEHFPMVEKAIKVSEANSSRMAFMRGSISGTNEEPLLKVIWAEETDDKTEEVICQLMAEDGGIVNSFYAEALDDKGNTVDKTAFVSFNRNMAFALLKIPKEIFSRCVVRMETASIGFAVRRSSRFENLEQYDTETVKPRYSVTAPVRKSDKRQYIKVSYYRDSPTAEYDYIFPGRQENQFYMPSAGSIHLPNITLKGADMILSVSAKAGTEIVCLNDPRLRVEGSDISYSYENKWDGVKLFDVFGTTGYEDVEYMLDITAQKSNGHLVTMLITNMEKIKELLDNKSYDSVHMIERINAYVDCLAAGTMIRMADGSSKAVEDLKPGELIQSKDGVKIPIYAVETQEGCSVQELVLENGSRVCLTDGHAVYTEKGAYPVSRLKTGQMLITETGASRLQQIIRHCDENHTVCALFLEDDSKCVFANGVKVHNSKSGELFRGRDWTREDLPEEWLEDYDSAVRAGIIYDG